MFDYVPVAMSSSNFYLRTRLSLCEAHRVRQFLYTQFRYLFFAFSEMSLLRNGSALTPIFFLLDVGQTPINTGKNKTRLQDIRTALGWPELDGQIQEYASPDVQLAPDFLPDFE